MPQSPATRASSSARLSVEDVHALLAEEPETSAVGVVVDQGQHDVDVEAPGVGDPGRLQPGVGDVRCAGRAPSPTR